MKTLIAFLVCGLFLYIIYFWFYKIRGGNPFDNNPFDNSAFDRPIWVEDGSMNFGGSRRGGMVEDILHHQLRLWMSRREIIDLLDRPEWEADKISMLKYSDAFSKKEKTSPLVMIYYLGEELGGYDRQGHSIDRAWLHVRHDFGGRYIGGEIFLPPGMR